MEYEMTIGLEVHVELLTDTKMFCACAASPGGAPNTHVCPICLGMPGTMPRLSRRAVERGVAACLVTGCAVAPRSAFDRKNYFYPDLPKGYQITQYRHPLGRGGAIPVGDGRAIGIERIHLEEDAGKLLHDGRGTRIDFNRAGVPLAEIVSRPEIRSAEEAKTYLSVLRERLLFGGVSLCRMNEGSMRCDVNLSVRPRGASALGVRTEIKNLNSIAFVGRAIEYEFARQVRLLEAGGAVEPETRRFDEASGETVRMRGKESAAEYRYLPEPDLLPLSLTETEIEAIRAALPETAEARRARWEAAWAIPPEAARTLTASPETADRFEAAAAASRAPRQAANLMLSAPAEAAALTPAQLSRIADLVDDRTVSAAAGRRLLTLCAGRAADPLDVARAENMLPIEDEASLRALAASAAAANPALTAQIRAGRTKAMRALLGALMRESGGRADARRAEAILWEILQNSDKEQPT